MATAQDIVVRALRRLAVVSAHEPAEPEDLDYSLEAFNMMLNGWKARTSFPHDTDYALLNTITTDAKYNEGLVFLLAETLAEEYQVPPPARKGRLDWWRIIRHDFELPDVDQDSLSTSLLQSITNFFTNSIFSFPVNQTLRFTSGNNGFIGRLIQFYPETKYDRPGVVWYNELKRLVAAISYHTTDVTSGDDHKALEVKTSGGTDPTDMITRESLGVDGDLVDKEFNAINTLIVRDATREVASVDTQTTQDDFFEINRTTNQTGYTLFSGRAWVGYDEARGQAVLGGGAGKGVDLITNGVTAVQIDSDATFRLFGALRKYERSFIQLPAPSAAIRGDAYMLINASAVAFAGIAAGGGTDTAPVFCDGTNWRYG